MVKQDGGIHVAGSVRLLLLSMKIQDSLRVYV
jgi:hypothetical protein